MAVEFYLIIALLVALAALFVVFPLMQRHGSAETRRLTNVEVFRERQRELDAELERGDIDAEQHDRLVHELQRRLLEDEASAPASASVTTRPARWFALVACLAIAGVSLGLYQHNGAKADWEITQALQLAQSKAAAGEPIEAERERLLAMVDKRLEQRREEPFYLMLKGNLQMEMARYREAESTFTELLQAVPNDPGVMSVLLEVRYLNAGRKLDQQSIALAQTILQIDPRNARTLGLLGIGSFEAGQYADAIKYWQQLIPLIGPFSPNGKMISQGIERARQLLAQQGGEVPADTQDVNASIEVAVSLAENIQAEPTDQVFIYARPTNGSRMPLAVQRITVADLPATVRLDDSMAMAPGMNLSSVEQVELVARISKRGMANRGSGDIEGIQGPVAVSADGQRLSLVIDTVVQ